LVKKHRLEAIQAKMNSKNHRGQTKAVVVNDLGSPRREVDRELLLEGSQMSSPASTTKQKIKTVGGL